MMDNKYLETGHAPDYSINNIPGARPSLFTAALIALLLIMTGSWLGTEPVHAAIRSGQFVEVTQGAGIDASPRRTFGVSWGDMNGDGLPDIWISHHARKPVLYINNGDGTFTDSTDLVTYNNASDMHGAAWADFDNDGDQDLFQIVGGGSGCGIGANQFLINNDGLSLEDKAADYGLDYPEGRGRTPLWFDWNGDGYLDIFLSNLKRTCDDQAQSALFTQQNGYFTNDNALTGIETNMGSDPVFAQLTHLGSGNAPALVIYSNSYPSRTSPHRVYQYDTVPFNDITGTLGLSTSAVEDAAVADFNGDLLTDFYFARAYINSSVIKYDDTTIRAGIIMTSVDPDKSFSFTASGNVTFKIESFQIKPDENGIYPIYIGLNGDQPTTTIFTRSSTAAAGMPDTTGIDFGIFIGYDTNTGKWKLSVRSNKWLMLHLSIDADTSISEPFDTIGFDNPTGKETDRLFIQKADGGFRQVADAGLGTSIACHSVAAADFDNDMDVDIYLVCRSIVKNFENILYENLGDGTFRRFWGHGAEGSRLGLGESVALADYDEDGFMDIFLTNGKFSSSITEGPDQLFRNTGNSNNWLEIDLEGVVSNRDGIGARVLATTE
ncbi:MAG: VCBS repeat-containing protein [Deferribacteres bacterium]|nr:VCBS repeat-containing protein [Deferribacteres bacterium]